MRLYLNYLSLHLKSAMQYKASFLLTSVGQLLNALNAFLGVYFLLGRFHQVDGFTLPEVLLCYGVVLLSFTLGESFFRGFDAFSSTVRNGEFDRVLVRPRSEMLLVLCSKLKLVSWLSILQAGAILTYALAVCHVEWNGARVFGLIFMVLGGVAYFSGLFLIYASCCFFTLEGLEFMSIFTDGGREYGRYPLAIYGRLMLSLFTFVLPMACFQYYPFLYLVGRSDNPLLMLTPAVCFVFLLPCLLFWRFGIRHYQSNGS